MSGKGMRLITLQEAMAIFGISRSTIDRWRQNKQLPFIKIGKEVFIDPEELEAWLRSYTLEQRESTRKERHVLKMAVGYQSGTAHMWSSLLIKETGFFEEELKKLYPSHYLEIDWYNGSNGLELLEGVIMGRIQIASLGDYPIKISNILSRLLPSFQSVLLAFDGKTPRGKGISIVVPPNSGVDQPEDLLSKQICTVPNSSASLRLEQLLVQLGGKDAEIIHSSINDSMNRIVDRTVGASVLWEPYLSLLSHSGDGKILFEDGMGEDYLTGIIANNEWAEQNIGVTVAYLKAHLRVHHLIRTRLDDVVKMVRHSTGIPDIVAWKVLSRVRWDSAIYARDLETLGNLKFKTDKTQAEPTGIFTKLDYLQMALEQMNMPLVADSPINGEWSQEQIY